MSVASAVAATTCASLPVIIPILIKAYKRNKAPAHSRPTYSPYPSAQSGSGSGRKKGFALIDDESMLFHTTVNATVADKDNSDGIELREALNSAPTVPTKTRLAGQSRTARQEAPRAGVVVEQEVNVTFGSK
jgi:hypothetical protein